MCNYASGTAYAVKKSKRAYHVFGFIGVFKYPDGR